MMKNFLFALVALILAPLSIQAYDFKNGDFYYNIVSYAELTCELAKYDRSGDYGLKVTIPETATYDGVIYSVIGVGEEAFYAYFTSYIVTMHNKLKYLKKGAFNCFNPITITNSALPDSLVYIGDEAFQRCSWEIEELVIPDKVTYIGDYAFSRNSPLKYLIIGKNVEYIGSNAFCGLNISEVIIPNSVTYLGSSAFYDCSSLEKVTIGNSVTSIGDSTFYECTSLTDVTLGNSVTSIGDEAFYRCYALPEITIPNSVTSIGEVAFWYCSSLTEVIIPNSVTSLGYRAFIGCSNLTKVTIGNSVTSIETETFDNCYCLTEVTIGKSVESIGSLAFQYCTNLTSMTSLNPDPPTCLNQALRTVPKSTCVLYVPIGSYDEYATANQWQDFLNIVEVDFNTDLYDDLYDNLWEVEDLLSDAWNTIKTKYPDISDDYEGEYETLKDELAKLFQELLDAYKNGTLDDDMAEEIRAKLEEIRKRIEGFLADAVAADIKDIPIGNNNVNGEFQIYTLTGARVNTPTKGNVYIFRFSDGTTKKVLIK